jgi:hypothetical protein
MKENLEKERRRSVRIKDRIMLHYQLMDKKIYQHLANDFNNGISLYNQPHLADIIVNLTAKSALENLREKDSDLVNFLIHLDNKINRVLEKIENKKGIYEQMEMQVVDFSENGIAFSCSEELFPEDILEFHIILLPDHIYIYSIARVVGCAKITDEPLLAGKYRIAAEFTLIMDEDQNQLVKHNFKQQSLALRNRKKGCPE